MKQRDMLQFICASGLVNQRFVTITKSTDTVVYTAAGAKPDGITVGDESNLKIAVQLLADLNSSFYFTSVGVIAIGGDVEVGADGKGQALAAGGSIACTAKTAATANSSCTGYNISSVLGSAVGTPGIGVTAVEESNGSYHKTILTIAGVLPAIVGGTNLGLGLLIYTLPAGAKMITDTYESVALQQTEGHITADTPIVGIGTVIAVGAITDLNGTGTFEDLNTGKATADCDGTATVQTAKTTDALGGLAIESGDAHTVHFNVADDWAATGDAATGVVGTVTIFWKDMD